MSSFIFNFISSMGIARMLCTTFCIQSFTVCAQEISRRYELVKMNDNVNTRYNEVSPVISPDGKKLYYFVANHPENTYGKEQSQDIWVSSLDDKNQWSKAKRAGSPYNENRFNQVYNFLPDGSVFIRGGESKNSKGFSIVSSSGRLKELKVTDFAKMDRGVFNGATISADARQIIMYFSEKEKEKFSDLYLSSLQPDGHYSRPVKLGISSVADDYAPFLAPDQKTLYFSSNRFTKERVGGSDIYKTTRLDNSWLKWSAPINLGKVINTSSEDAYFSIDSNGNIFTARAGAALDGGNFDLLILKPRNIKIKLKGNVYSQETQQPLISDIQVQLKEQDPINMQTNIKGNFQVTLPEVNTYTIQATAEGYLTNQQEYKLPELLRDTTIQVNIYLTSVVKQLNLAGNVLDEKTNKKILHSSLRISSKSNHSITFSPNTAEGSYQQEITNIGWYIFTTSAEGYLDNTDSLQVRDMKITPIQKDIRLTPVEVGITVRLKNIYFNFDESTLKPESFEALDKVVDFLQKNPTIFIEISGHTDSKGSDLYNLTLSQGRSQSVVDYLISQGIEKSRLQAHGYGESKSIDTNETEEGRSNNRRVEFTIVKI